MPYEILLAPLSDRRAAQLLGALQAIEAAEAVGFLIKAQYDAIKAPVGYALDEAFAALKKAHWFGDLNEPEKALYDVFFIPYPHLIPGWLAKAEKAEKAAGPYRDAALALLRDAEPLCARLLALKPLIGKRAPSKSAAQLKKDAEAKECQICGRRIFAEVGKIAHHGYERPYGMGWQSASCEGARHLPFEASRDALVIHLDNVAARISVREGAKQSLEADAIKAHYKGSRYGRAQGQIDFMIQAGPDDFDDVMAKAVQEHKRLPFSSYEQMKALDLKQREQELAQLRSYYAGQKKRAEAWKPSLKWSGSKWVAL